MKKFLKFIIVMSISVIFLVFPSVLFADQAQNDSDIVTNGNQNSTDLGTFSPGATVSTSVPIVIWYQGGQHCTAGSNVTFTDNATTTNLPTGYSVSTSTITIPADWGTTKVVSGSSNVSFTAPATAGTYIYKVDWNPSVGAPELADACGFTITIKVEAPTDTTAPTTTIGLSGTSGLAGWYVSDVGVTLNATDNAGGSGVKEIHYILNSATEEIVSGSTASFTISTEGVNTLSFWAVDNEGNIETQNSQEIKIDKTVPIITVTVPQQGASYLLNEVVTADWSATDATSGINSAVGTVASGSQINTSSVGSKSFEVTATDNAGNTDTKTVTYKVCYDFIGVLQPINLDGSSVFKLKSTIPVKFQLKDASGNFITDATAYIFIKKISNSTIGDEAEAVSTSAATTGNLFRYDFTANQYIFNLGTKTLSTGTWQIIIKLDDGSEHIVEISLK
jgi:hypothetical protein